MSTTLLQELQGELRRLYIAGSDLAADDFRLKKMEPKLAQLGERAPVFKRMAEGVAALTGSAQPEDRALKLQDLSLLINSVLSTQGTTAPEGTVQNRETTDGGLSDLTTVHSYRQLAEVQNALSDSGGGRYEIVRSAYDQGLFRDLRLFPFAIRALGDSYSEIGDLAAHKILPAYGAAILPYLLDGLNIQGGREEERRLEVVRRLGVGAQDNRSLDILVRAAEEGSDKVRAAAIACLGSHPSFEDRLLEWSLDKKKTVREGAYAALAARNSEAGRDRLYESFVGKDALAAAEAIGNDPSPEMIERLLKLYEERLRSGYTGEEDRKSKDKLWKDLEPFTIAFRRAEHPGLERLYLDLAEHPPHYPSLGRLDDVERMRILHAAAGYLKDLDTPDALSVLEHMEQEDPRFLPYAFHAARRQLAPAEVYNRYAGSGWGKLKAAVSRKAQVVHKQLLETLHEEVYVYKGYVRQRLPQEQIEAEWDPRWLDWTIERDDLEMVAALAAPGSRKLLPYLKQAVETTSGNYRGHYIFIALDAGGFDEETRYELLMRWMEKKDWKKLYTVYHDETQRLLRLPDRFAGEAADRLEPLIRETRFAGIKEEMEEIIHSLRRRASSV
ncbi:HEAT repeat domain-containing protein [Saccharibacillus sp. CPCC 101409]|uniref:HEAT repeat domain-containing protein n=1 Tax=Saccharibacillus sp. CPCC 101409 TaxID=3058041 RepID=UPI0026740EF2|nr:HEAT repeat domain-containing protein [Saccharibacillus sp. CPCC 101409]MDO3409867.1 HEAT repeat domain-containing protein [Saccharibacillus sp. CPCC 101409]